MQKIRILKSIGKVPVSLNLHLFIENEIISRHFFSLDKSIFDLIKAQKIHTEYILSEIQTCIIFRDQNIEIDRIKIWSK